MVILLFQALYVSKTCLHWYMIKNHLDRLSFALAASKIKEKARVVAMDLRGHGKSSTENELDLSVEVHIILGSARTC